MSPDGAGAPRETILRAARPDEADAIEVLMRASIHDLFPLVYDATQTASAERFVASVDRMLIDDGTYFVVETGAELVACGGWSRRDKLYTGSGDAAGDVRILDPATEPARIRAMFTRPDWTRRGLGTRVLRASEDAAKAEGYRSLALMATLPGYELYLRYGFRETGRSDVRMPDGVLLPCVAMDKRVD